MKICQLFIISCVNVQESKAADHISWLQKAPRLTTYRVNPLRADIDKLIKTIQAHLENVISNFLYCELYYLRW